VLRRVAARHPVAIVSGRDLEDVRARVGLEDVHYAGCHGFEIAGPRGSRVHEAAAAAAPQLGAAADMVAHDTAACPACSSSASASRSPCTTAACPRRDAHDVHEAVAARAGAPPGAAHHLGQEGVRAAARRRLGQGPRGPVAHRDAGLEDALPVYVGDDVTDEDAFRALEGAASASPCRRRRTHRRALWTLRDPDEVRAFLAQLA
jgi:trehalose-6-phosphatase